MSRIIVKNLPPKISDRRLRDHFGSRGGVITDCQLKFSPTTGQFRQFAFVGFKSDQEAREAIQYFNSTYLDAKKITVELCSDLSSRPQRAKDRFNKDRIKTKGDSKRCNDDPDSGFAKRSKVNPYSQVEDDPEFQQFLSVQKSIPSDTSTRPNKYLWSDDLLPGNAPIVSREKKVKEERRVKSKQEAEADGSISNDDESSALIESSAAVDKDLNANGNRKRNRNPKKKKSKSLPQLPETVFEYTVKIKGLPPKIKRPQLKQWIDPIKFISLRIPPHVKGIAYMSFATPSDLKSALMRHRGFLDGNRIEVIEYDVKSYRERIERLKGLADKKEKWASQSAPPVFHPISDSKEENETSESLAESGRLFVRNLSYECTQEDLEKLFSPYGQLSEVHLSLDNFTSKPKGFAFVEFVFPEHALVAHNELDGRSFQGRMLHIIPAKAKPQGSVDSIVEETIQSAKTSYKKEKLAKEHEAASRSHNWNALFLGANAIADLVANKVGVSKAQLLADRDATDSIAVRMALAETQIVNETKQFLVDNGINLDAFSDDAKAAASEKNESIAPLRSKTVMLAKNLPQGTTQVEIEELFSRFGTITKLVLPPHGITAIVEMSSSNEAKSAFKGLAYSNFKHTPLYLEWAPVDVIHSRGRQSTKALSSATEAASESGEVESSASPPSMAYKTTSSETGTTLFVKNLNFATQEASLREHFSQYGPIVSATIAKKKHNGKELSMGYGFVQFSHHDSANDALKSGQHSSLDGHTLELKRSTRNATFAAPMQPIHQQSNSEKGKLNEPNNEAAMTGNTKLVVRNIPFEASEREVRALFHNFGELVACRLPKKLQGTGSHRGFAFVEFGTSCDARRAFESLSASTHLYGRRLVLEWASNQSV